MLPNPNHANKFFAFESTTSHEFSPIAPATVFPMKNRITIAFRILPWFIITASPQLAPAQEKPSFKLQGFATIKAYGLDTTTGGGDAPVKVVHTPQELLDAAERTDIRDKKARNNSPRVIQIANDLDLGVLANQRGGSELPGALSFADCK